MNTHQLITGTTPEAFEERLNEVARDRTIAISAYNVAVIPPRKEGGRHTFLFSAVVVFSLPRESTAKGRDRL